MNESSRIEPMIWKKERKRDIALLHTFFATISYCNFPWCSYLCICALTRVCNPQKCRKSVFCPGARWWSPCESGPESWGTREEWDDKTTWAEKIQSTNFIIVQGNTSHLYNLKEKTEDIQTYITYTDFMRYIHATKLQTVGVGLVMWHQVIVVEKSDPEHGGVDAHTQEEDSDEARHLVGRNKITGWERMLVKFNRLY